MMSVKADKSAKISIHPPQAGWDAAGFQVGKLRGKFQSTHPRRGGTRANHQAAKHYCISIHPPQAGWDAVASRHGLHLLISIHPPQAGWDRRPT